MTTIKFEGKEIELTSEAEYTNRLLNSAYTNYHEAEEGEEFSFEMSAQGIDEEGNEVVVYWIFEDVKGDQKELDEFDYDEVDRVETV
jgi:hypothetical protein